MNADELKAAAEYVPPIRYGCDELDRYGGMSIEPHGCDDVWDVLHETAQAQQRLAEYVRARLAADKAAIDRTDETEGDPIGWTIVAIGKDGSVLCNSPTGNRRRYLLNSAAEQAEREAAERQAGRNVLVPSPDGRGLAWLFDEIVMSPNIDPHSRLVEALRALGVEVKGGGE